MSSDNLLKSTSEAILVVLRDEWAEMLGQARMEDGPELAQIAQDAAKYAIKLASGHPEAASDLAYVKASALLLASKIQLREKERLEQLLLKIATIAAKLAAQILLKIPVA